MATRGNAPFQKRQKELARKDKQKRKEERRAQRKLDKIDSGNESLGDIASFDAESEPESDAAVPQ